MQTIKTVFITLFILGIVTIAFANWGASEFGGNNWGAYKWGASSSASGTTYWDTPMSARWNTPMSALWNTSMDTEIP